ncbi:hypothetical protein FRC08_012393 [Ceratobasidium sp. 394]|nr:hypothetical protein FRC08_012393 [Ceratobasidium sp. 394]KAG9077190.1 hypothetical protein FS749_010951 [Ceratobasidium sp. UAMH 11750]
MNMFPTLEDINAHIEAMESYVASHLPNAPELPPVLGQVWVRMRDDLMRFGPPSMPELPASISSVFVEVPPSRPPPPMVRLPAGQRTGDWLSRNKWPVIGVVVGSTLLAGYLATRSTGPERSRPRFRILGRMRRKTTDLTSERREIILLLGADHAFGLAIARDLVSRGYVVIASVARAELADELESHGAGFIRALVLDSKDPTTLNPFLRDMRATLGLRFPLGTAGDPYASPASHAHIVSLVSLLSLTTTTDPNAIEADDTSFMPLSSMSLTKDYLPRLISAHVTPFGIIQGVLPHLRNTNKYMPKSHPSIVVLQSAYTLGAGRSGADAIVTAANTTSLDVFRRELRAQGVDVFELDVGLIDTHDVVPLGLRKREAARREKLARQVGRTPSSFEVLADAVAEVVGPRSVIQWWKGSKRPVGAGARTYTLASRLPTRVLDFLLSFPHGLLALRKPKPIPMNAADSFQPPRILTSSLPRPEPESTLTTAVTPSTAMTNSAEPSPAAEGYQAYPPYNLPAGSEVWHTGNEEQDSWVSLSGRGTPAHM